VISVLAVISLAVAFAVAAVLPTSWFLSSWPEREIAAVRRATLDPGVRVFATDRHADWLLWRVPSLRGRMAFDVRFELYDSKTLDGILRYNRERGPEWKRITDGYAVVVLDRTRKRSHARAFLAEPGARLLFQDGRIAIIRRAPTP
jgi:hypothetical protein